VSEPIISVVIPCYNGSAYIDSCVRSVLEQKANSEIIIVDDGSTDDSIDQAKKWMRDYPRLMVVLSQANQGPAAARNAGLRMARGKYVCFLDVDDQYIPGFFTAAIQVMEGDSSILGVFCEIEFVNSHREVDPILKGAMETNVPGNIVVRTEAARQLGGFPVDPAFRGRAAGEDSEFRQQLHGLGRIVKIAQPLFRHLVHRGSHFDFFLDRATPREDGSLKFKFMTQEEMSEEIMQAIERYHNQVKARASMRLGDLLQTSLTANVELAGLLRRINGIAWRTHPAEEYAMHWLAKRWPGDGDVLQVGRYASRSTAWLASGCKIGGRGKVIAIDPGIVSPATEAGEDAAAATSRIAELNSTMAQFELGDVVEVRQGGAELANKWNSTVRMLFIGGDNTYEETARHFHTWSRFVDKHGLVLIQGMQPPAGAAQFYAQVIRDREHWKDIATVFGTGIVEKLA